MFWLPAFAFASAASVEVHIQPEGAASAVAAVVRGPSGVRTAPCNDAGVEGDLSPDGVWTCAGVQVEDASVGVLAVVDGRLVDGGAVAVSGQVVVSLAVTSAGTRLAVGDAGLTPRPGSVAAGPGATVLARILGYGSGPAPVLELSSGDRPSAQLGCHDDGRFPDRAMNDGDPGCIGPAPGRTAKVQLIGGDGARRDFGGMEWPTGPFAFLTVDLARGTASIEPFDLPLPGQAVPTAETGSPGPAPSGASGGTPGGVTPAAATTTSAGITPAVWATGLAGCLAGAALLGLAARPRGRVRSTLRRVESAPLFPGGPSLSEPAAVLHVAEPLATLPELLTLLGGFRRIVLVLPPDVAAPSVAGAAVWVATVPDALEVAAGARELARTPGLPVAVLVVGAHTLQDPGSELPDPVGRLLGSGPPGAWVGCLVGSADTVATFAPAFDVAGPPWRGQRR